MPCDWTFDVTGMADKGGKPPSLAGSGSYPPPPGKDLEGGLKAGFVVTAPRPNWLASLRGRSLAVSRVPSCFEAVGGGFSFRIAGLRP